MIGGRSIVQLRDSVTIWTLLLERVGFPPPSPALFSPNRTTPADPQLTETVNFYNTNFDDCSLWDDFEFSSADLHPHGLFEIHQTPLKGRLK
jgi:hypothetical protein